MRRIRRTFLAATVLALVASTVSGCDFDGAYDLPLPGGPIDHDKAFTVTAEFADVLNVVPRSPVMVSDVTVGEVVEVERTGWTALVTMKVREDIELPDNATAEIRQTSLLGEKYVALLEPARDARGRLGEGDRIAMSATGRNPEVEEVLGALSFLLSGGGVGQIRTITTELNEVMSGRTGRVKNLMGELNELVGTLDEQKGDIIRAMESMNQLAKTLNKEEKTIEQALEATGPALQVLNEQHRNLARMLRQLDRLGRVGTRVINGTKEDLIADLAHLQPILGKLNETGDALPRGLSLMISFPFPQEAADIAKGDYANASFALDVSLAAILTTLDPGSGGSGGSGPLPGVPGLPGAPELPGLPGLPLLPGGGGVGTEGGLLGGGLG